MKRKLLFSAFAALFIGCGGESVKSVEEFVKDGEKAFEQVRICDEMAQKSDKQAQNCANAGDAVDQIIDQVKKEFDADISKALEKLNTCNAEKLSRMQTKICEIAQDSAARVASRAATDLITAISDTGAYWTAKGEFAPNLNEMTNVPLEGAGWDTHLLSGGKKCIRLALSDLVKADNQPALLSVVEGSDANEAICKEIYNIPSVKKIMHNEVLWTKADGSEALVFGAVAVSGIAVTF